MPRKPGLACHACNRSDFATEASLKAHTAKFHTPGVKSPRGFRVKRDVERDKDRSTYYSVLYRHTFKDTGGDDFDFKRFRDKGAALRFRNRIVSNGGQATVTTKTVTRAMLRQHKAVYGGKYNKRAARHEPFYDGEHMTRVNSAERRRGRRWKKRMEHMSPTAGRVAQGGRYERGSLAHSAARISQRDPAKVVDCTSPAKLRSAVEIYKGMGYYEESSDGHAKAGYWVVVMRKGGSVFVLKYQR